MWETAARDPLSSLSLTDLGENEWADRGTLWALHAVLRLRVRGRARTRAHIHTHTHIHSRTHSHIYIISHRYNLPPPPPHTHTRPPSPPLISLMVFVDIRHHHVYLQRLGRPSDKHRFVQVRQLDSTKQVRPRHTNVGYEMLHECRWVKTVTYNSFSCLRTRGSETGVRIKRETFHLESSSSAFKWDGLVVSLI